MEVHITPVWDSSNTKVTGRKLPPVILSCEDGKTLRIRLEKGNGDDRRVDVDLSEMIRGCTSMKK